MLDSVRRILFGGTFNPLHNGHLALISWLQARCPETEIILIPTGRRHPHGKILEGLNDPEEDRLRMIRSALASSPRIILWEGEIKKETPSYTIDTLDEIRTTLGFKEKPGLLIGDDLLDSFSSWKSPDRLARESRLLVARRYNRNPPPFPYPHYSLENPLYPCSSQELRTLLQAGSPRAASFLPPVVFRYIREHRLYGFSR